MRTSASIILWLLAACVLTAGCTQPGARRTSPRAGLVGKPPMAEQDPFAERTLPVDALEAPVTGVIGDEGGRSPASVPEPEPAPAVVARPAAAASPVDGEERCFSCVRVCPDTLTVAECEERNEELICGWGVDEDRQRARRMARAQCDAALNMSRQMRRYSEIEGDCPPAACR